MSRLPARTAVAALCAGSTLAAACAVDGRDHHQEIRTVVGSFFDSLNANQPLGLSSLVCTQWLDTFLGENSAVTAGEGVLDNAISA